MWHQNTGNKKVYVDSLKTKYLLYIEVLRSLYTASQVVKCHSISCFFFKWIWSESYVLFVFCQVAAIKELLKKQKEEEERLQREEEEQIRKEEEAIRLREEQVGRKHIQFTSVLNFLIPRSLLPWQP